MLYFSFLQFYLLFSHHIFDARIICYIICYNLWGRFLFKLSPCNELSFFSSVIYENWSLKNNGNFFVIFPLLYSPCLFIFKSCLGVPKPWLFYFYPLTYVRINYLHMHHSVFIFCIDYLLWYRRNFFAHNFSSMELAKDMII